MAFVTDFAAQIRQTIRDHGLFVRGQAILVAVSGGADSMVLLHVLNRLARLENWTLTVAHFNHQLRGAESRADESLVRTTARELGLKCVVGRANVAKRHSKSGESLEMAARTLRHGFLARTAKRLGITTVALAHHADDQVELFFVRLFRGAGGEGLRGMQWMNPSPRDPELSVARPLLATPKTILLGYARSESVVYRHDASNADVDPLRNRIRNELLPLLTGQYQPALARKVLQTMEVLQAETELATAAATNWLSGHKRPLFSGLPRAVQRQCIVQQLIQNGVEPGFELVEKLRLRPWQAIMVSPGRTLVRTSIGDVQGRQVERAKFNRDRLEVQLPGDGSIQFGTLSLSAKIEPSANRLGSQARLAGSPGSTKPGKAGPSHEREGREIFDADRVGGRVLLRYWQPGDRFQPIGMRGHVKLQDWLINLKIPRPQRHRLVVGLTAEGEIFWVQGQRIAEGFKVHRSTKRWLIWKWRQLET